MPYQPTLPSTQRWIEFKKQTPGVAWEQTPVLLQEIWAWPDHGAIDARAQHLATIHGVRVRWNIAGLEQGHYMDPEIRIRKERNVRG